MGAPPHACAASAAAAVLSLGRRLSSFVVAHTTAEGLETLMNAMCGTDRDNKGGSSSGLEAMAVQERWLSLATSAGVSPTLLRRPEGPRAALWASRLHALLPSTMCPCPFQSLRGIAQVRLLRLQALHAPPFLSWVRNGDIPLCLAAIQLHNFRGSLSGALTTLTGACLQEVEILFASASASEWAEAWKALGSIESLQQLRLVQCRAPAESAKGLGCLLLSGKLRHLHLAGVGDSVGAWVKALCDVIREQSPISPLETLVLDDQRPTVDLWPTLFRLLPKNESALGRNVMNAVSDGEREPCIELCSKQRQEGIQADERQSTEMVAKACLSVRNCRLGVSGLQEILKRGRALDSLDVSDNSGLGDAGAAAIGQSLARGILGVSSLTVERCAVRGKGVRALAAGVGLSRFLRCLSIAGASAAGVGGGECEVMWATAFTTCTLLETVRLSRCMLTKISPLISALSSLPYLRSLDLSENFIGDCGAQALATALADDFPLLREISLRGCGLTSAVLEPFLLCLIRRVKAHLPPLLLLDLRDTRATAAEASAARLALLVPRLLVPPAGASIPLADGIQEI